MTKFSFIWKTVGLWENFDQDLISFANLKGVWFLLIFLKNVNYDINFTNKKINVCNLSKVLEFNGKILIEKYLKQN